MNIIRIAKEILLALANALLTVSTGIYVMIVSAFGLVIGAKMIFDSDICKLTDVGKIFKEKED